MQRTQLSLKYPLLLLLILALQIGIHDSFSQAQAPSEADIFNSALSSQLNAIDGFERLLQRNRAVEKSAEKEKTFLIRIIEACAQGADYAFKFTSSKAFEKNEAVNTKDYEKLVDREIVYSNQFIQEFPTDPRVTRIIFLRGRSLNNRGRTKEAIADLTFVLSRAPRSPEAIPSALLLYDLHIAQQDYKKSLFVLDQVNVTQGQPAYLIFLHNRAQSHYLLNETTIGLEWTKRELAALKSQVGVPEAVVRSQRETALQTAASYYSQGIHKKTPGLTIQNFTAFVSENATARESDGLVKILAYSLASDSMEKELQELVQSGGLSLNPSGFAETNKLELLLFTFEHQRDQKLFGPMQITLAEVRKSLEKISKKPELKDSGSLEKARHSLTGTSELFQKQLGSAKIEADIEDKTAKIDLISQIYLTLLSVPGSSLEQQVRYRFNLAEAATQKRNFTTAVIHLTWIMDNTKTAPALAALRAQAETKVLSTQYEAIKAKALVPGSITAVKLESNKGTAPIDPLIDSWIRNINIAITSRKEKVEWLGSFFYEASRILYSNGRVVDGTNGLKSFALAYPTSEFAAAAGSLVIDTYVLSEEWDTVMVVIDQFRKINNWKDPEFVQKITPVALEANLMSIKKLFSAKKFDEVLRRVEASLKTNPTLQKEELEALAAQSALSMGNQDKAQEHFSQLKGENVKNPEFRAAALLSAASTAEALYHFESSAKDYRDYFVVLAANPALAEKHAKNNLTDLRKKVFLEAWLSGNYANMMSLLREPSICDAALLEECRKYKALSFFMKNAPVKGAPDFPDSTQLTNLVRAPGPNAAIWAVLALQDPAIHPRLALDPLITNFEKLDALIQLSLLDSFRSGFITELGRLRSDIKNRFRIQMKKESITARANAVKALESFNSQFLQSHWSFVRQAALFQNAQIYFDFAEDMNAVPPPPGLKTEDLTAFQASLHDMSLPFDGKAKTFLDQAFTGSADETIQSEYFKHNPDVPPSPLAGRVMKPAHEYFMDSISDALLKTTIQEKNVALATFILNDSKGKNKLKEPELHTIRAMILSRAGAMSESSDELDLARTGADALTNSKICTALVYSSAIANDSERTKKLMSSCGDVVKSTNESIFTELTLWLKPSSNRMPASLPEASKITTPLPPPSSAAVSVPPPSVNSVPVPVVPPPQINTPVAVVPPPSDPAPVPVVPPPSDVQTAPVLPVLPPPNGDHL